MAKINFDQDAARDVADIERVRVPINILTIEPWVRFSTGTAATEAVAWLDASARPDIADLERVHYSELGKQFGVASTQWSLVLQGSLPIASLRVRFKDPVACDFALSFDLTVAKVATFVAHADLNRHLVVTTRERGETDQWGIDVELGGQRLGEALRETGIGDLLLLLNQQRQDRVKRGRK